MLKVNYNFPSGLEYSSWVLFGLGLYNNWLATKGASREAPFVVTLNNCFRTEP